MGEAKNIYFTCLKYYIIFEEKGQIWARRKFSDLCRFSDVRRRLLPWRTAKVAKASSRSMEDLSISSSLARLDRSRKSPCCCWEKTGSRPSTFACASTAVVTSLKSTPFDRPFPSLWWPIIKSTWTRHPRKRSKMERAQEVRRSRSQSQIPKVLPLNLTFPPIDMTWTVTSSRRLSYLTDGKFLLVSFHFVS